MSANTVTLAITLPQGGTPQDYAASVHNAISQHTMRGDIRSPLP